MAVEAHERSSGATPKPLHKPSTSSEPLSSTCALPPSPTGSPFGTTATASQSKHSGALNAIELNNTPPADAVPLEAPGPTGQAPSESPPLGSTHARPTTTARACRICFGEEEEGDELGRLLAPCLCRGTARYVHQDCLRSWREADKLNSFYACGQCGERYRFRKTRVTALLGNRLANLIIATTMLLLVAFVAGFAADPLLRLADVDVLDPKTGELILLPYSDPMALGDTVHEIGSAASWLLDKCAPSRPGELVKMSVPVDSPVKDPGDLQAEPLNNPSAHEARYGEESATAAGASNSPASLRGWPARALLHVVQGLTVVVWATAFVWRILRGYTMFLIIARLIPISWTRVPFLLRWARLRHVPDPPGLFWSFLADIFWWQRPEIRRERARGRRFSGRQQATIYGTLFLWYQALGLASEAAAVLVKRGLACVEDAVVDLDEMDGSPEVKSKLD